MAETIRGLSIEIAADATKFNGAMRDLKSGASTARGELAALQKGLNLEYNPEKLKRAQAVAQEALDKTREQADLLTARLQYLEGQGQINTDEYRNAQKELARTETAAQQLEEKLRELNDFNFDRLTENIEKVGKGIENAGKKVSVFSVAAAGALAGGVALAKGAVKTADDVATLAAQYGTTATAIQRFRYVALQTDTAEEDLYKGLVKVRAGVADLATGTTSAAGTALQQLGLDFQSFSGSEEQFYAIIDALASMEDRTQMVAIANDIFGDKLANNLLPMIYAGTEAVNGYRAEFESLGAMSDEQVAALAAYDNVMNEVNTRLANAKAQLGTALLPLLETVTDLIREKVVPAVRSLADWFGGLSDSQQTAVVATLGVIAVIGPALIAIGKMATGVSALLKLFHNLNAAQIKLAAGFAAMGAAIALCVNLISGWKEMTWVERLLKSLALAALVAAAAVTVFHAAWSLGIAIGAIAAGIVAGLAAINAAREEILPESDEITVDGATSYAGGATPSYGTESGSVYDEIGSASPGGTVYNYDNSTHETTQNVTVVIENYAQDVDVDALVEEINLKLAEAM